MGLRQNCVGNDIGEVGHKSGEVFEFFVVRDVVLGHLNDLQELGEDLDCEVTVQKEFSSDFVWIIQNQSQVFMH